MAKIFAGRYAAKMDEPFAVFIIGVRVNNFFAFRKLWQISKTMPAMLKELGQYKDKGLLHYENILYWRGTATIQYWKSFDHLERYAHEPGGTHPRAWAEFNKTIGGDGSVGIWHETYAIEPGRFESVYGNMPKFGLAAAAEHVPAEGRFNKARDRFQRQAAE